MEIVALAVLGALGENQHRCRGHDRLRKLGELPPKSGDKFGQSRGVHNQWRGASLWITRIPFGVMDIERIAWSAQCHLERAFFSFNHPVPLP